MNLQHLFDCVAVISLPRRRDRWRRVCQMAASASWPFSAPRRWPAIDGRFCPPPVWWKAGGAAWGCYQSHLRLLENCLNDRIQSVLVLEDDAVLLPAGQRSIEAFFNELPGTWRADSLVYLGGQHQFDQVHPPRQLSPGVLRPFNVNRTHAYAVFGQMLPRLYRYLHDTVSWPTGHHIDHRLGDLHEQGRLPIYAPTSWFFGQEAGFSDIASKNLGRRTWAVTKRVPVPSYRPTFGDQA